MPHQQSNRSECLGKLEAGHLDRSQTEVDDVDGRIDATCKRKVGKENG
jgi:hypothetical protein